MLMTKDYVGTIAWMGGIPFVYKEFCQSAIDMVQYNSQYLVEPGEEIYYNCAHVSYHAYARNVLADEMKGDWILFLDTDHQFEPDLAVRMVRNMYRYDMDVLTGIYCYKRKPFFPLLYKWSDTKAGCEIIGKWDSVDDESFVPIDAAGGGCLLVRRRVLDRIGNELQELPFDIIHPLSEDISFFKRVSRLGIQAYCDPRIESFHLATRSVRFREDFNMEEMGEGKKYLINV